MMAKLRTLLASPRLSRLPRLRTVSSARRYSVVSAVYDVAPYLDGFLRSLTRQSLDFDRHIDLILVDDGSRDRSAEIIRGWQAVHPSIRCVRKENGGQASARNVGLAHATGDWVTFIDPDDLVDARYFERVDALLSRPEAREVALVACKMLVHRRGRSIDEHALSAQFDGDRIVDARSPLIQLSAASAFFRGDRLREQQHLFDEALRPVFEDGLFVGRYRIANPGAIGLCATAEYGYRKRDDASSTIDGSWAHAGRYGAVLERGYLELLRSSAAASASGRAPTWAQRTVLYEIVWYLRMLVDRPETIAFLTAAQKERFRALLGECMAEIDEETIARFDLAGCTAEDEVGLLGTFKGSRPPLPRAIVDAYDDAKRTLRVRTFHSDARERVAYALDGDDVTPTIDKVRRRELLGETFVHERIAWIPAPAPASVLAVQVGGIEARLEIAHTSASTRPTVGEIARALTRRARPSSARWYDVAELQLATSPVGRRLYGGALLFMDRDTQADDNAEHLYRYVLRNRPDLRAFFVLRRSSHDWPRLEREGFRLIPFGSLQHRVALLNAKHLISSHAEHFVLGWPTVRHRRELQRSRFTFLQHGVIKDDLSGWLNAKDIDCFVAASPAEHASIVESGGPYKFTSREVVLTGLPRHDALLARTAPPERVLLVMPTWRQSVAGPTIGKSSARAANPAFYESEFALRWKRLLRSPALESLATRHGFRVQFFPHANLASHLDWFDPPPFVDILSHREGVSFQDVLARASLMLTDYSSAAFDMAYLRKPVVYYQFDREQTFGGGHTTRKGYFDYDRDGFGPVCTDEATLLRELERLLVTDAPPSPEQLARMERALPLRDGRCSQRVLTAILDLDRPTALHETT
ncbi:MAG: CDP-glycerol glycerophosphotransferase family protein [Myxococcota bacterium]|nr:CDP-glycerol glycerophosphotransferase family protein [Myxococcota bacterium]